MGKSMQTSYRLFLAAIVSCINGPALASDRWHQLAEQSDRLTSTISGRMWEQQMLLIHNRYWGGIYQACAAEARKAGVERFKAVAIIDSAGVVKEFLINPSDPHLECFSKEMVGRKYPEPPSAPFYEVFSVTLDSP